MISAEESVAVAERYPVESVPPWHKRLRYRAAARATGRLINNRRLSESIARALLLRAKIPRTTLPSRLALLLVAARRAQSSSTRARLRAALQPYLQGEASDVWRTEKIGWGRYYGEFGEIGLQTALSTTLVLKAPGENGEKGVLYSSFEYNWMRLIASHDARAVLSDYLLVGASSWSPTDFAALANLAGLSSDPAFIGVSNLADMDAYAVMRPAIEPLPILASDWVNPDLYQPKPHADREIDILMVAHWGRFKRHWLLWEALRGMPRNLRVVLVGRNLPGRTENELRAEARSFGVRQDLECEINVPPQRVAELQCDARTSAIFSFREGSCVSTAESLFANSPVAMMQDAHVGSKAYINPRTGALFTRDRLSDQMTRFLEESSAYSPREWAVENISCHATSARLNRTLRDYSLGAGLPWTSDIAPLSWRYVPTYVHSADAARLQPAVEQLRERHGVELERFVPPA